MLFLEYNYLRHVVTTEMSECVIEQNCKKGHTIMTIESTYYTKHSVNYFQSWHMLTTNKILQTPLQKRNTINDISFCITSYTCYIYTMTMSGNLKQKWCAYDTVFKLKVVQYADNCNNNRQTAWEFSVSDRQVRNWRKSMLDLAEMPQAKKASRGRKSSFPER